jgi:hypothetical protein
VTREVCIQHAHSRLLHYFPPGDTKNACDSPGSRLTSMGNMVVHVPLKGQLDDLLFDVYHLNNGISSHSISKSCVFAFEWDDISNCVSDYPVKIRWCLLQSVANVETLLPVSCYPSNAIQITPRLTPIHPSGQTGQFQGATFWEVQLMLSITVKFG